MSARLGPYELLGELGRGSWGVVYRARRMGREVALKVLEDAQAQDRETIARFEREAQVTAGFRHPGLVRTLDYGREGPHLYYAMELVEGENLAERVKRERFESPAEACRVVSELCAAVQAIHEQGVVHRDLKPENVLLDAATGSPRLTDFGMARLEGVSERLTLSQDSMGTPLYMAPEQFRSAKYVDERADVYSLGGILFVALAGRPPFMAVGLLQLADLVANQAAPLLRTLRPDVPEGVEAAVARALEKEPENRYSSADEFAAALAQALREERVRPVHPKQRRVLVGLAVGVPLLALVVALLAAQVVSGPGEVAAATPAPSAAPSPEASQAPAPRPSPVLPPPTSGELAAWRSELEGQSFELGALREGEALIARARGKQEVELRTELANALFRWGRYADAYRVAREASTAELGYLRAWCARLRADARGTLDAHFVVLERFPKSREAELVSAEFMSRAGRRRKAVELVDALVKRQPADPWGHYAFGEMWARFEGPSEKERAKRTIRFLQGPSHRRDPLALVLLAALTPRSPLQERYYRSAHAIARDMSLVRFGMWRTLMGKGEGEEALEVLGRIEPNTPAYLQTSLLITLRELRRDWKDVAKLLERRYPDQLHALLMQSGNDALQRELQRVVGKKGLLMQPLGPTDWSEALAWCARLEGSPALSAARRLIFGLYGGTSDAALLRRDADEALAADPKSAALAELNLYLIVHRELLDRLASGLAHARRAGLPARTVDFYAARGLLASGLRTRALKAFEALQAGRDRVAALSRAELGFLQGEVERARTALRGLPEEGEVLILRAHVRELEKEGVEARRLGYQALDRLGSVSGRFLGLLSRAVFESGLARGDWGGTMREGLGLAQVGNLGGASCGLTLIERGAWVVNRKVLTARTTRGPAIELLRIALQHNPENPQALLLAAMLTTDLEQARTVFAKAKALDPQLSMSSEIREAFKAFQPRLVDELLGGGE